MASGGKVAGIVIAATIVMSLFNPISGMVSSTTGTTSVGNEQVTVGNDEFVQLDGYNLEEDSVTVEYSDGSNTRATASEGTDYELKESEGAIKALSDGALEDGQQVWVSYSYARTDGTTALVLDMVPLFVVLLVLGTFAKGMEN